MLIFAVLLVGIVAAAVLIRIRGSGPPSAPRRALTRPGAVWKRLEPGDRVVLLALVVGLLTVTTLALYVVALAFT